MYLYKCKYVYNCQNANETLFITTSITIIYWYTNVSICIKLYILNFLCKKQKKHLELKKIRRYLCCIKMIKTWSVYPYISWILLFSWSLATERRGVYKRKSNRNINWSYAFLPNEKGFLKKKKKMNKTMYRHIIVINILLVVLQR